MELTKSEEARTPKLHRGFLLSLEGLDLSGKSTQAKVLKEAFDEAGIPVSIFREPGSTYVGEEIRYLLLSDAKEDHRPLPPTSLLLFMAARAELYQRKIAPALNEGHLVICDRFIDSSLVYQHWGQGLDLATIESLNDFAIQGAYPDLTIYFTINEPTYVERLALRQAQAGGEVNALDLQPPAFRDKLREGYETIFSKRPRIQLDFTFKAQLPADQATAVHVPSAIDQKQIQLPADQTDLSPDQAKRLAQDILEKIRYTMGQERPHPRQGSEVPILQIDTAAVPTTLTGLAMLQSLEHLLHQQEEGR